jgi:hypothetical protein
VDVIRYPARYSDSRGEEMWDKVMRRLVTVERQQA